MRGNVRTTSSLESSYFKKIASPAVGPLNYLEFFPSATAASDLYFPLLEKDQIYLCGKPPCFRNAGLGRGKNPATSEAKMVYLFGREEFIPLKSSSLRYISIIRIAIEMIKLTETHFKSVGSWSNPSSICHFKISIVIIGFINSLLIINVFKWWHLILLEGFFPNANTAIYWSISFSVSSILVHRHVISLLNLPSIFDSCKEDCDTPTIKGNKLYICCSSSI